MTNWPVATLGDICDIQIGKTPARKNPSYWGDGHAWLSIRDMNQGTTIRDTRESITQHAVDELKMRPVSAGTVLFSFKLSIGKVGITSREMFTNEAIAAFIPKDEAALDMNFLLHFLQLEGPRLQGNRAVMGATLNKRSLASIAIPLPPLDEQQRIAGILDAAMKLQNSATRMMKLLHELEQSSLQALEKTYHHELKQIEFGQLIDSIENGKSPRCEARKADEGEYGVLKLSAVTSGIFKSTENKALLNVDKKAAAHEIKPDDFLMTRKNTPDLVGAVTIARCPNPRLLLPDLIYRLHFDNSKACPEYMETKMQSPKVRAAIRSISSGSAKSMSNISKSRLNSLSITVPPLSLQQSYSSTKSEIRRIRKKYESVSESLAELYNSLATRAFAGEL